MTPQYIVHVDGSTLKLLERDDPSQQVWKTFFTVTAGVGVAEVLARLLQAAAALNAVSDGLIVSNLEVGGDHV